MPPSTRRERLRVDPLLLREGTSRNGWQPTADACLPCDPTYINPDGSPKIVSSEVNQTVTLTRLDDDKH